MNARRNIEAIYNLTPLQEGILYHALESSDPALYMGQYSGILDAELAPDRLHQAWQELVRRHAVLRTLFAWRQQKAPLQLVRQRVTLPWTFEDWQTFTDEERGKRWDAFTKAERRSGFELNQAPLARAALFREDRRRYRFYFCYHHLLFDGWSLRLLLDEAATIYNALTNAAQLNLPTAGSYADFVEWLKQRDWQVADNYWSQALGDFSTPTPLPLPTPDEPVQQTDDGYAAESSATASTVVTTLSPARVQSLHEFARAHHLTVSTLFIGAWTLLLSRYGETNDILFGTAWAGRPAELAAAQHTVGLFINTLPMRVQVLQHIGSIEWLQAIQTQLVEMREHEQTPLLRAQRASQVAAGQRLFESLVVYQAVPTGQDKAPWVVHDEHYHEYGNYPLAMLIRPGQAYTLTLVYQQQRFARNAVSNMLNHFMAALDNLQALPAALVSELDILTDTDRSWLLNNGCATAQASSSENDNELAVTLIERAARLNPQSPALIQDTERLSYRMFAQQAEALAQRLCAALRAGGFVAVFLPRSPRAMIALFATLKVGAAYVPLDPSYPAAHTQAVLADLGAATLDDDCQCIVITDTEYLPKLPQNELPTLVIDETTDAELAASQFAADTKYSNRQIVYVMYTSGTTGTPKGVCVSQANLASSLQARSDYYPAPPSRFLLLSSLATDSSIAGIFWTLCNGGTLVLPKPQQEQSLQQLVHLIETQRITHLLGLPSLYSLLLENASAAQLQSLQSVIVAGEACTSDVVRDHCAKLPHTTLYNEYGPSEATVWATVARLDNSSDRRKVLIGRPISNTRLYLLDTQQRLTPQGLPGELYIGGVGVALGYLGHATQTREKFVVLAPTGDDERLYRTGDRMRYCDDGQLEFLGRVDHQIKVRGHRVEVEEIERVLLEFGAITQAAVVLSTADDSKSETSKLVAFLCTTAEQISATVLRNFVKQRLPDFMVPHAFIFTQALPLTPGGKIDRRTLAAQRERLPIMTSENRTPPRNDIELTLIVIWQDVLKLTDIGIHDNFFDLGGDSLLSIRILAHAHRAGLEISPVDFFARPTIAEQAAVAKRQKSDTATEQPDRLQPRQRQKFALANLDSAALATIASQLDDADSD